MTETNARILCDSVSSAGHRLITFECTFPRIVLAEVNTHRDKSRNSASSRAIPVEKMIKRVLEDPYVPTHWGKNQKGMQADEDVDADAAADATGVWLAARDVMVEQANDLLNIGIHKQITNRLLEAFMWHTALVTGTEWSNFENLRDNKDAHPDFRDCAHMVRELRAKSNPKLLGENDWHAPLLYDEDFEQAILADPTHPLCVQDRLIKISVGRCARVSYLTHDGKRDHQADVELCERLLVNGHMSPFEHVARPMTAGELELFKSFKFRWNGEGWAHVAGQNGEYEYTHFLGNVQGWVQYRKLIPHEDDILGARQCA